MSIISFIENGEVIRRILEHLGLWLVKRRPQPRAAVPLWRIAAEEMRFSFMMSRAAEGFAAGRSWESKRIVALGKVH